MHFENEFHDLFSDLVDNLLILCKTTVQTRLSEVLGKLSYRLIKP